VFAIVFPLKRIAETQIDLTNSQKDDPPTHNPLLTVSHFPFFNATPYYLFAAAVPAMSRFGGGCVDARRAGFPIWRRSRRKKWFPENGGTFS